MTQNKNDFQGYKVLPLKLLPNSKNCHQIFAKEHFIRVVDADKPKGRTLFLLNIPPYVNKDHLKQCFEKVGEVTSILFSEKPGKDEEGMNKLNNVDKFSLPKSSFIFKVAYVVFKATKSLQSALELKSINLYDETTKKTFVKTGIEKWTQEYMDNIIPEDELQKEIDLFMIDYDAKEKEAIQLEKSAKADNDGWITVGKHGKNTGFEQKESVINKLEEKIEKSRKNKELKNFYTFQIRESKMQNIVSLRKKFEEDKKKIETLKKTRRFKPF